MGSEQYMTHYDTLTVEKCFGNNHYVVPEYQREYVWEESNVEQLLADLIAAYKQHSQKPYFMGMMVVCATEDSSLELVDGQQRITTFFLLLSAMAHLYEENHDDSGKMLEEKIRKRKMNKNGDAEDRFALELQYEASSDCLAKIYDKNIPSELDIEKCTDSDKRLYGAYFAIIKTLKREFKVFSALKKFAYYVLTNVEFVQVQTVGISDALKIFETINDRGVGLSPMDLLKNMLFMKVKKEEFPDLKREWKKLIDSLEKIKERPLRFLRYFISATYDITDSNSTIKGFLPEDEIYKWLTKNEEQCGYSDDPFTFVNLLNKSVERYKNFLRPNPIDLGDEYLKNIPRAAGSTYRLHLVLLMSASKMEKDVLDKFKQVLESVVYYLTINSIQANETEKVFATWCPKIRKIITLDDLKEFVNSTVVPQINKWKSEHKQNFLTLSLSTMQQYRIRYILARIAKYVDDFRSGGNQYADINDYYDDKKKYPIEHIMPQTCDDFGQYDISDEEEFRIYIGRLGNLTLWEKTLNSSYQNKPYSEKMPGYLQSQIYLTKSLPQLETVGVHTAANRINKHLRAWTAWTKEAIEERQEMLYQLSEMIWSIDSYISKW